MVKKKATLRKKVVRRVAMIIMSSLAFLLALQYNDLFTEILNQFFPTTDNLIMRIISLLILTVFIVLFMIFIEVRYIKGDK